MRLYVLGDNKEKIELKYDALNRKELAYLIGSTKFKHEGKVYSVNDVIAESDKTSTPTAAFGAILGALGGGVGIAIGGAIGALVGENITKEDEKKVVIFNESNMD
ncbi:glycine zipper domain-containing protein [Shewanella scandinavica]|uniref:glycine zipper domain-containing protein n=1 Tax=Shewanella scandinavica TaxID=3063538 RepID=UPI00319C6DC6